MTMFDAKDICKNTISDQIYIRPTNKYATQLNYMIKNLGPIILATDGALQLIKSQRIKAASSALVMCSLDIRLGECLESGEWKTRPVIPMCSRCSILPRKIGVEETDIASAECLAMLLTELSLPSFLPRIYITDSEAVRDQALQARDNIEGEINRSFIRANIGGIGKCIMGTMASLIHQGKIEQNMKEAHLQNPLTKELIEIFKERNSKFLDLAHSWTVAAEPPMISNKPLSATDANDKNVKENRAPTWRKDYFDSNTLRSFLKVNSHQLCDEGLQIKKDPRYPALVPNLCLLNANHIADKIADIPFSKRFAASELCTYDIRNPISPLRFAVTLNGQSVDKHVSSTLKKAFTTERIKRIKTKDTQGLLWRVIESSNMTWRELSTHKGYLRSLLGLSRTHTRSIYKNVNYKQGCKLELMESLVNEEDKLHLQELKQKELTSLLCQCSWCPSSSIHRQQHGNRMHALLNCGNENLRKFRNNMRTIINEEICIMITMIERYTSTSNAKQLIMDISDTYLQLQSSQEGRLKKIPTNLNHAYISLNELKEKYDIDDTLQCILSSDHPVAIELFGLVPQHTLGFDSDATIGIADITWLGLIPSRVNNVIGKHRDVVKTTVQHLKNRAAILETLDDKWKLIKGLIMGLAAGIHKVIGTTSREILGQLQRKHKLEVHTVTALKKKIKRNHPLKATDSDKHFANTSTCIKCIDQPIQIEVNHQHTTNCSGVTCTVNRPNWEILKNFKTNKIPREKKHCLRCTRHSSAIRAAVTTLENFYESSMNIDTKKLKPILSKASANNPCYFQLMHLLQQHLPTDKQRGKTKYTTKSRISDTHKTMCRIITQVYAVETATTHSKTGSEAVDLPKKLKDILQKSESNISNQRDRKKVAEFKAQKIIQQVEIATQEVALKKDHQPKTQLQTIASLSEGTQEEEQRTHYLQEILLENGYISNMAIRRAIEVLRHETGSNQFFANPEASSILECWTAAQGWRRAARMFGSSRVTCRKPDGVYFIPIFEGGAAAGHWMVAIVHKQRRHRRGYVLDSLGNANLNAPVLSKIKDLFKSAESSFAWSAPSCSPQTEVECGPRTIMHIAHFIEESRKGSEFESCLIRAASPVTEDGIYSASRIREAAAEIVGRYEGHMWTNPLRIHRNQENGDREVGESLNKRRRKRRRKTKPSTGSSIIELSE